MFQSSIAQAQEWPPASPQDVLRLTPKKNKSSQLQPSPLRNSFLSPSRSRYKSPSDNDDDDSSDSDDEEILRLKLAKIEAKLRLKELEKKKRRKEERAAFDGSKTPPRPKAREEVQVPVSPSPQKRPEEDEAPPSPSRVLLGIDKGLRARDISLRRAPGMSLSLSAPPPQPQFSAVAAAALRNATNKPSPAKPTASDDPFAPNDTRVEPTKSFAQRIAEQRNNIQEKEDKVKKVEKARSKAWESVAEVENTSREPETWKVSNGLSTSRAPGLTDKKVEERSFKENQPPPAVSLWMPSETVKESAPSKEQDAAGFDTFSCLHLSRRLIQHNQLSRQFTSKELFSLPALLKTVVGPDYDPPDTPGDWVVLGVIASKSAPRDVAREGAGKYLVLTITDLKWEVELFLFGQSFEKYYKIGVGTVVAILNPGIMKPRIKDSSKFSLTLTDASDTLMEIGLARDLGACKARKRDGNECGSWVDTRHTEFCSFHVEQTVKKQRAGRMEVNSMSKMYSPPKKGAIRPKKSFLRGGRGAGGKDDGLLAEGPIFDLPQRAGGAGGKVFVTSVSSARLIDNDRTNDIFNTSGDKGDRLRKHLAKIERERDVTRKLLSGQDAARNAGFEYLRSGLNAADTKSGREVQVSAQASERPFSAANVRSIGFDPTRKPGSGSAHDADAQLVEAFKSHQQVTAGDVHLSPVKLKRKSSLTMLDGGAGGSASSLSSRASKRTRQEPAPMGWHQRPKMRQDTNTPNMPAAATASVPATAPIEPVKEAKSVKFAPMPTVESDDEDDLEIIDWVGSS